jgi:hypothetical protein
VHCTVNSSNSDGDIQRGKLQHSPYSFTSKHSVIIIIIIIIIIIGATGIVKKSLRKNLEVIPGKHSIDSLQQTAILGTSHIIRKVLQCET